MVNVIPVGTNTFEDDEGYQYDVGAQTKDVSLQLSEQKKHDIVKTAALLSRTFQMNFSTRFN